MVKLWNEELLFEKGFYVQAPSLYRFDKVWKPLSSKRLLLPKDYIDFDVNTSLGSNLSLSSEMIYNTYKLDLEKYYEN